MVASPTDITLISRLIDAVCAMRIPNRSNAHDNVNVPAELTITKATTGSVFELSFRVSLHGPCVRCLADAELELPIRGREYHATKSGDEELRSPYVIGDETVDLSAWARDAIALALPDKILCRTDCAGLCPECGKDLNVEPHEHEVAAADSRWAALEALRAADESP